jgi:hypothetical protein
MRIFQPTVLAVILTIVVSSTALGGNIGGTRSAGNIGGTRSAGNIGGTRSTRIGTTSDGLNKEPTSRVDFEITISGTFASVIRMLLESGALF